MKIPKYMHEPLHSIEPSGLKLAARALRLDAQAARKQKCHREFSRALEYAAGCLMIAAKTRCSMAAAFEWPEQSQDHPL